MGGAMTQRLNARDPSNRVRVRTCPPGVVPQRVLHRVQWMLLTWRRMPELAAAQKDPAEGLPP